MIIILLLIPTATALLMCEEVITPNDIPCAIISTWDYKECSTRQAKIYNSTPALVLTKNFSDYGASTRCNITWNITDIGSYIWNVSTGDSGHIIVEVDETMTLAVVIGLTLFSIAFGAAGLYMWTRKKDKETDKM